MDFDHIARHDEIRNRLLAAEPLSAEDHACTKGRFENASDNTYGEGSEHRANYDFTQEGAEEGFDLIEQCAIGIERHELRIEVLDEVQLDLVADAAYYAAMAVNALRRVRE